MQVERPGTIKQRQALLKLHYELMGKYMREGFTKEESSSKAYSEMFPYKKQKNERRTA